MTKPRLVIEFRTVAERYKGKFTLRLISTKTGLISSFVRNGKTVSSGKPSMAEVVNWITANRKLVIALIQATRADEAATRRALKNIAQKEKSA
jgi:hypothetical protein